MKNILIVDDEPHIQRVLKVSLERAGYTVQTCLNGEEALQKIQNQPPSALLSDIDMPRMSGRELCIKLNEDMPERDFPIFIFTARAELEHREWTRSIPKLEFFEKPISVRRILNRLDDWFKKHDSDNT